MTTSPVRVGFDVGLLSEGVLESLSDSGSGTGAASLTHLQSNAVNVAMHNTLTSAYNRHQVSYSNVCAVRDEEAAGSNPATPTSKTAGHIL